MKYKLCRWKFQKRRLTPRAFSKKVMSAILVWSSAHTDDLHCTCVLISEQALIAMALRIHGAFDISPQTSTAKGDDSESWFLPDNASQACLSGLNADHCRPCPNEFLIQKILRWIKLAAVKVGRSYYALPAVLLVATLLGGLLLGFALGRRHELRRQRQWTRNQSRVKPSSRVNPSSISSAWHCGALFVFQCIDKMLLWGCTKSSLVDGQTKCLFPSAPPDTRNRLQSRNTISLVDVVDDGELEVKERSARVELQSASETERESGLSGDELPRHIAVIMDGNRRYGVQKHGDPMLGHWDGSRKLLQFAKWCLAEQIPELTVYAFSTENWQRDAAEVASLMGLIAKHCEELRVEAVQKQICVRVLSTDVCAIPPHIRVALRRLEEETAGCTALQMNICLSYGSRGEIVEACRTLAEDFRAGRLTSSLQIDEDALSRQMLVSAPDVMIRTSGEVRLSNFLLWQLAYAELFFLDKNWPELEKNDLLEVLRSYGRGRQRRFGR